MNKLRRILALLTVIVIVALIIGTIVCAVTGSPYFFGMLALSFVVPIILWICMWFSNLVNGKSDVIAEENEKNPNIEE